MSFRKLLDASTFYMPDQSSSPAILATFMSPENHIAEAFVLALEYHTIESHGTGAMSH